MSKKTSARLGAGTLALATVVAGLSFGPAAANAAELTLNPQNQYLPGADSMVKPTDIGGRGAALATWRNANSSSSNTFTGFEFSATAPQNTKFDPAGKLQQRNINVNDSGTGGAWHDLPDVPFAGNCTLSDADTKLSCLLPSATWTYSEYRQFAPSIIVLGNAPASTLLTGSAQIAAKGSTSVAALTALTTNQRTFVAAVDGTDLTARTADISGTATPGSTVIINDTISVPVGTDGQWSYTVTGLTLGKNTIKLEQYEGDNNKTGETSVVVDLAVAPITANAVFLPDVTKPLTISGTAQAGATVEIYNGTSKVATVRAADGTGAYTADIPAPNAGGVQSYTVKQVLQGETAAGVKTVTADFGAQVTITTPVNDQIHDGGMLHFEGRGVAGATVELREQGKQGVIKPTQVLPNGIWSMDANIPAKNATYVVTQTGKGNNVTTSAVTLNPDATDAQQPVVNPIAAGDNVLVGTGGTPGATIIVRDDKGNEVGSAPVDENGNWKVTVPPTLGPGKHDLDVVEVGEDGKESEKTHVVVDFGKAVDALTPTMDAPVKDAKPTFTGTGQPGATVVIAGTRAKVATTTVDGDGTWSVPSDVELPAGEYVVTATQTTGIGVKSADQLHFVRTNDAPVATPVKLLTPTTGTTVNTKRPTFTGTGFPGAMVEIRGTRATVTTTKVDGDGNWSVTSPVDLPNGDYRLFAEQTPQNGAAKSIDETTIKVAYRASDDIVVTGPTDQVATPVGRVTFTGKADPNATVTIEGTTAQVASGLANDDGTFSITSSINFPAGDYRLVAKQVATNGEMKQSASFLIKVRG